MADRHDERRDLGSAPGTEARDVEETFAAFLDTVKQDIDMRTATTVLVAEESRTARQRLSTFVLQVAPLVKLVEAENGLDAIGKLDWLRQTTGRDPHLIITALDMPVMDGWQLIDRLKREYEAQGRQQGIPVIAVAFDGGKKHSLFGRKSVLRGRHGYSPLVAVADANGADPKDYDAIGERGLVGWIKFFLKRDREEG